MKRILVISLLLQQVGAISQITFTEQNSLFQPGPSISYTYYDGDEALAFPTSGGNNAWDFSNVVLGKASNFSMEFSPVSSTDCATSYPNSFATYFHYEGGSPADTAINFMTLNATALVQEGEYYSGGFSDCIPYLNSTTWFEFPFSLGDSFIDTYEFNAGNEFSNTIAYTASGSIALPNGAFYQDCALIEIQNEQSVQYLFYAYVNSRFVIVFFADNQSYSVYYPEFIESVSALPNVLSWSLLSTSHNVYFIDGPLANDTDITIYDATGRIVGKMNNQLAFSIENQSAGLYFVDVAARNEHKIFKVIKE